STVVFEVALGLVLAAAPQRVVLVFGGDVIPHGPVKQAARLHARWDKPDPPQAPRSLNHEGWDNIFGPLGEGLRNADLAIVHLETPISGNPKSKTGNMLFDAPSALLDGLASAGVDVATFANNHCLDQKPAGIVATREAIVAAGLLTTGADLDEEKAWAPLVV